MKIRADPTTEKKKKYISEKRNKNEINCESN